MSEQITLPIPEATGYSDEYSFDEAFRDALDNLPPPPIVYPDQLLRTRVVAIGSEQGGLAGLNRLYVRVRRLPDPIAGSGEVSALGGDIPFPLGRGLSPVAGGEVPFPLAWSTGGGEPFPLGVAAAGGRAARLVYSVNLVGVDVLESRPPKYHIRACGQATTTGWSNGRLRPVPTKKPPEDGIYDFEFIADPPSGIVAEVITPIASHPLLWQPGDGSEVEGVRVIASANSMVRRIEG